MKYLSLDFGTKRIGVATSDSGIVANEYTTLVFDNWPETKQRILSILALEKVENLIIGLPKNMDGTDSKYSTYIEDYAASLEQSIAEANLETKIYLEDERLTSSEAERQLREQSCDREEIKKRVDLYAAKLILEQYLDN